MVDFIMKKVLLKTLHLYPYEWMFTENIVWNLISLLFECEMVIFMPNPDIWYLHEEICAFGV